MMALAPRVLILCLALVTAAGCSSLLPTGAGARAVASPSPQAVPTAAANGRPASSPSGSPTPQPQSPGATPPGQPAFAAVIKDARRIDGVLTAWQKDEKLWLELRPEQLGKPFLFSPKVKNGIGEGLLVGGLMTYAVAGAGGAQVVEFVRVHNTIRLQARNTDVSARQGTPEALALQGSYSASLLGAAAVASQPHPDRKSILIDASSMFLSDMSGLGLQLQRQFRQGYGMDARNSLVTAVRGSETALVIETQTHWYTGSVNAGQGASPQSGTAAPTVPRWLPDTRSLLIGQHLSFMALPEQPMAPRRADPRLGHFTTRVLDFSDELARTPVKRYVARWRLEKKDPSAEVSEPVKPITFWIDRNVPQAYRETVRSAILEWNKAFDRIGLHQAIRVEQQSDDAPFDTLDPGYPSVRWLMSAEPQITAIGQTQLDPRSGEIVDANIAFEGLFTRAQRYARSQLLAAQTARSGAGSSMAPFAPVIALPGLLPGTPAGADSEADDHRWCRHGDAVAEQARYALDLMEARGELEPDSPLAQQFVLDYVKDTVMHEVGHALGLRHNFRASRAYTEAQLSDSEFTRAHGTTGSVMEYTAVNLARPGESAGVPFQLVLGPYDYWAIEYAYRPAPPGATPAAEDAMLQAVAARSHEPLLAFGTDEDASFGLDAETIQFDLGADPLAFAGKRLDIARDLFHRQETRQLPADRDYSVLRRSLGYALSDATRAIGVLVRQLGGLRTLRDYPGSGRDPIEPVPAALQREAFDQIARAVFAADGFRITPALQRRLAPDYLDRGESPALPTDYNLPQRLLELQRAVLAYLLSDQLAVRLLDANDKLDAGADTFGLAEIHQRLAHDLWSELATGASVPQARRDLQRDYINRLAFAVQRPTPGARADARAAMRRQAQDLLQRLDVALGATAGPARKTAPKRAAALAPSAFDENSRLHLLDCAESLRQALAAQLQRTGI